MSHGKASNIKAGSIGGQKQFLEPDANLFKLSEIFQSLVQIRERR
jgi:hypothetical protein